jgi:hypothetical protein
MARRITCATAIAVAAIGLAPMHDARAGAPSELVDSYAAALGLTQDEGTPPAGGDRLVLAALPLAQDELADLRGGFALPGGLHLAFGFDIEARLGGVIVQRLSMPLTQIGVGTPRVEVFDDGRVASVLPGSGPLTVDRTFSAGDAGQTRVMTSLDRGVTGLVQNSRDGALVQRRAEFQVDIAGMGRMLESAATRRMIGEGLPGGRRQ